MAKKRAIGYKRELIEPYTLLIQKMVKGGEYLANLEYTDSINDTRRFKRVCWELKSELSNFIKTYIEPIQKEIKGYVPEVSETEEQTENS